MIVGLYAGDAGANLTHDARAFVAEDRGEDALAVQTVQRIGVGVADTGRHDLDQNLALLRPLKVDFDDFERLLGFKRDGGAGFHGICS